jgi:hypothetical protein
MIDGSRGPFFITSIIPLLKTKTKIKIKIKFKLKDTQSPIAKLSPDGQGRHME